jgi:hypothetical protein
MRRLTRHRDDSGAVTIFVVIAMPVLILFAALVLDGARGYVARRETQNSADAAALAMATDCAMGLPTCVSGADTTAGNYNRSLSQRSSITNENVVIADTHCDTTADLCKATMQQSIGFHFAPGDGNVTRSGTAKWKHVGVHTATTLPIAIANCEFSPEILDGAEDITLLLDNPQPQTGCSSLPGGFSQLADNDCEVTVSADETAEGKPGNDLQDVIDCILPIPRDVLIPIYDAEACHADPACKGQGPYPIVGFAMFRLTGYWFTNNHNSGGTLENQGCPEPEPEPEPEHEAGPGPGPDPTNGPQNCIAGDFVKFVTSKGTVPNPDPDFGAYEVHLVS